MHDCRARRARRRERDLIRTRTAEGRSRAQKLAALTDLSGQWLDKVQQRRPPKLIVLDMDSSESPTYGEQEGSAYNGHFGCTCYHPLFVFNQLGDVERCALRPDRLHVEHYNAHTGQFIIGAVFTKSTRRNPGSFVGLLSEPAATS